VTEESCTIVANGVRCPNPPVEGGCLCEAHHRELARIILAAVREDMSAELRKQLGGGKG
jgi:hypothetical protein